MLLALAVAGSATAQPEAVLLREAGAGAIRRAAPVVELAGQGGRTVLLADIHVPPAMADAVAPALEPLLGRALLLDEPPIAEDRWGRRVVRAIDPDGRSLQADLVGAGIALVQPLPPVDEAHLEMLLEAEASAAEARRGLWALPAAGGPAAGGIVVAAEAAAARLGQFAILDGVVLQASAQQRYFYLNFGADWRTDASARIDRPALLAMQRAGFDPALLEGRRVRLRGVVFEENGPMIELWTHFGIEVDR